MTPTNTSPLGGQLFTFQIPHYDRGQREYTDVAAMPVAPDDFWDRVAREVARCLVTGTHNGVLTFGHQPNVTESNGAVGVSLDAAPILPRPLPFDPHVERARVDAERMLAERHMTEHRAFKMGEWGQMSMIAPGHAE